MGRRIGVLTGGGDCPGLNAAIRAIVRRADGAHNITTIGLANGWQGVLEGSVKVLDVTSTRGLLYRGGTILGTSRLNPVDVERGPERIRETLDVHGIDGLIVIGGEGTLSAATRLSADFDIPIVGIPKTIDNDLGGTDFTIGFSTALDVATDAVDRLHTTAESHNRVMFLELMGRNTGWIATLAGMAGGADAILIPEVPFDIDKLARHLKRRHGSGRPFSIVVVAEGAVPAPGTIELPPYEEDDYGRPRLGGIAQFIAGVVEARTGYQSRYTILGHVQRGGPPNAFDRVLGTSMGVAAIDLAAKGTYGCMVGMDGYTIRPVDLAEATRELKLVPHSLYEVAEVFFG